MTTDEVIPETFDWKLNRVLALPAVEDITPP